ncbi:MAG: DegT/DnrJ/EryC1/StrS family aminotransferase [Verrucomicrobia bacterium]|nr:DegT/DnrJ/EryC1/StrS family aminotransferase [Verrucomicrobiota bacterium]
MNFFHTHISPKAVEYATEALRTGWVSEGPRVKQFEAALAEKLGFCNPVCVNSGTTALHLALALAGVGPDDEVILPAQTFVATGLVILMQGAKPVFADIDPATGNIAPDSIRRKITPRTKAVMPVHWAGYPCDMDEINAIAAGHNLAVVEDAAHALGATYRGRPVGALSRFTCFSFQAIKHLTCGDGGALCCLRPEDAREAFVRRWFGIDRAKSQPSILGERLYDISAVGYKYHLNDLGAAVGLGNLEDFPQRLARRQAIAARYSRELAGVPGVTLLRQDADRVSACWLFTLLVERREDFIRKLAADGVPSSVVHLRIDHNSVFGGLRDDLPGQAWFNARQVAVPVHEGLTDADCERVVGAIKEGW